MGYVAICRILVPVPSFLKNDFFKSPNIQMGKNFETKVFPEILECVSERSLIMKMRYIKGQMNDSENLEEIGAMRLFTPDDWTRALYSGIVLQEKYNFLKIDATNLSYLKLKDGEVLAVYALFNPDGSIWRCGANPVDDRRRKDEGRCLLSLESSFT